jgi:hypothetical protein
MTPPEGVSRIVDVPARAARSRHQPLSQVMISP